MDFVIAERTIEAGRADRSSYVLERECETWDWARAAGVSALELRRALRELLDAQDAS